VPEVRVDAAPQRPVVRLAIATPAGAPQRASSDAKLDGEGSAMIWNGFA
jgi:hypothetical protein